MVKNTHGMKRCLLTGKRLIAAKFGKAGCGHYSRAAFNHFSALRNRLAKQGITLSIPDYRRYMGYPPLNENTANRAEMDIEATKVAQFLKNPVSATQAIVETTSNRKCGRCGQTGHNRRTCGIWPNSDKYAPRIKVITQWMEEHPNSEINNTLQMLIDKTIKSDDDRTQMKCWVSILALMKDRPDSPIKRGRY
jgi:hypothetical protein